MSIHLDRFRVDYFSVVFCFWVSRDVYTSLCFIFLGVYLCVWGNSASIEASERASMVVAVCVYVCMCK